MTTIVITLIVALLVICTLAVIFAILFIAIMKRIAPHMQQQDFIYQRELYGNSKL